MIDYVDLGYRVYEKIKEMILAGTLRPGEKIIQEKIASQLGVSRTPVLKALQMLESELLVENVPRRGVFVKKMSMKEMMDAFECRVGLEGVAARLASEKATYEQILALEKLFAPFESMQETIPVQRYTQVDRKFHMMIINISENAILKRLEMIGNIHIITYQRGLIRPPHETLPEHLNIVAAIARKDPEGAEQEMRHHLRVSIGMIRQAVEKEKKQLQ